MIYDFFFDFIWYTICVAAPPGEGLFRRRQAAAEGKYDIWYTIYVAAAPGEGLLRRRQAAAEGKYDIWYTICVAAPPGEGLLRRQRAGSSLQIVDGQRWRFGSRSLITWLMWWMTRRAPMMMSHVIKDVASDQDLWSRDSCDEWGGGHQWWWGDLSRVIPSMIRTVMIDEGDHWLMKGTGSEGERGGDGDVGFRI